MVVVVVTEIIAILHNGCGVKSWDWCIAGPASTKYAIDNAQDHYVEITQKERNRLSRRCQPTLCLVPAVGTLQRLALVREGAGAF